MCKRNAFQGNYVAVTLISFLWFDKLLEHENLQKHLYKSLQTCNDKIYQISLSRKAPGM